MLGPYHQLMSATPARGRSPDAGAVLLEVVLALMLFVAAAVVIGSALKASSLALERLRIKTHAADLAVTFLSEVELGIRPAETAGPENFEPPEETWTWELALHAAEEQFATTSHLQIAEVIIREEITGFTYRLAQIITPREPASEDDLFAAIAHRATTPPTEELR